MEMSVLIIVVTFLTPFQINGYSSSEVDTGVPIKFSIPYEGSGFEGDILFPDVTRSRGVAMRGNSVRWANGIVPYEFTPGFAYTEETFIIETMQKMESLIAINDTTCIHFRPKNASDIYYITFRNAPGCTSYIGQNTGLNFTRYVTLQHPGCIYEGTIMHELLHALGFYHEQSRPDRDTYVRINFTNIQPGLESAFMMYNSTYVDTLNTSYDYDSVMHYGNTAFSVNGFPPIETIPPNITIGRSNISSTDILEVRILYNCSASGAPLPPVQNTTLPNIYVVNTTVSSALTSNDRKYNRYLTSTQSYYYHIYSITVPVTGYYSIMSDGANDSYGYIYFPSFNSNSSSNNLVAYDDNSGGNQQFKIIMNLPANTQYILVVTTAARNRTGPYTIIISGLNSVSLDRVYEYDPTTGGDSVTSTPSVTTDDSKQIIIIIVVVVNVTVLVIVLVVLWLQQCIRPKRIK